MSIFKKIDDWLDDSNRRIHMYGGWVVLIAMLGAGLPMGVEFIPLAVLITIAVFLSAVYVDMKDKQQGNKFDWSDVLAQMIPCIYMWLVIGIVSLIKVFV